MIGASLFCAQFDFVYSLSLKILKIAFFCTSNQLHTVSNLCRSLHSIIIEKVNSFRDTFVKTIAKQHRRLVKKRFLIEIASHHNSEICLVFNLFHTIGKIYPTVISFFTKLIFIIFHRIAVFHRYEFSIKTYIMPKFSSKKYQIHKSCYSQHRLLLIKNFLEFFFGVLERFSSNLKSTPWVSRLPLESLGKSEWGSKIWMIFRFYSIESSANLLFAQSFQ